MYNCQCRKMGGFIENISEQYIFQTDREVGSSETAVLLNKA